MGLLDLCSPGLEGNFPKSIPGALSLRVSGWGPWGSGSSHQLGSRPRGTRPMPSCALQLDGPSLSLGLQPLFPNSMSY